MEKENRETESTNNRKDNLLSFLVFGITAIIFYPTTRWLIQTTFDHQQLSYAFFILIFAGLFHFYENKDKLKPVWQLENRSILLLTFSYSLMALFYFIKILPLIFASYSFALASLIIFVFGKKVSRATAAWIGAFFLFSIMAMFMPYVDWPLRGLAGKNVGWILSLIGYDVGLSLVSHEGIAMLILSVDGKPFNVAAECNGFGALSSSLLLSLLLILYMKIRYLDKIILFFISGLIGFLFNILRILIIVILAPKVGDQYMLMHEVVGNITLWSCLALVWWVVKGYQTEKLDNPIMAKKI